MRPHAAQQGDSVCFRVVKVYEKNYTTHDLELGAIVFTLKIWRHSYMKLSALSLSIMRVFSTSMTKRS
jgi:hypothetical protein